MDNNMQYGYQPTVTQPGYGGGNQAPRKPGGRGKLIAGGVAAAVLVGGAAFGAVTMLSSSPATAAAGPTGQAAVLNDALTTTAATTGGTASTSSSADSAGSASTSASAATALRHRRDALARLRRLGGIDGQFTFETKSGPKTLAFERGTIQSVSGNDVVVKAKDGTTWNWTLVSDSVVREDGSKASNSDLSAGELVFVGGPVVSGSHDARLIVVRDASKSGSSGSSPSASTSAVES